MQLVSILYRNEDGSARLIKASSATWDEANGSWLLEDGTGETIEPADERGGIRRVASEPVVEEYRSSVNPEEILLYHSSEFVELLPTSRINDLLQRPMSYGRNDLLRLKYSRGPAQMAVNMVVLVLALSAVLSREPQRLMAAAMRCAVLCGICLAGTVGGQMWAARPPSNPMLIEKWPAIMAWAPVFVFGPMAVVLLGRVRT